MHESVSSPTGAPCLLHAQPEKRHGPSCRHLSPRGRPVCCPRPRCREAVRVCRTSVPAVTVCTLPAWPPGWRRELQEFLGCPCSQKGAALPKGGPRARGSSGCGPRSRAPAPPQRDRVREASQPAHSMQPGRPADQACRGRPLGSAPPVLPRGSPRHRDPTFHLTPNKAKAPPTLGWREEEVNSCLILFKATFSENICSWPLFCFYKHAS